MKHAANLWIKLMTTGSRTATINRMVPRVTPHMKSWLKSEGCFLDRIISKDLWPSKISWPNSAWMWGALKGKVYVHKPRTVQELEPNIRREVAAISEDVLQVTFANMQRLDRLCLDSGGGHFQRVSHEATYLLIYVCSKCNAWSLRYSHFPESISERITLYNPYQITRSFHVLFFACIYFLI
jgi:hypothetical protein